MATSSCKTQPLPKLNHSYVILHPPPPNYSMVTSICKRISAPGLGRFKLSNNNPIPLSFEENNQNESFSAGFHNSISFFFNTIRSSRNFTSLKNICQMTMEKCLVSQTPFESREIHISSHSLPSLVLRKPVS